MDFSEIKIDLPLIIALWGAILSTVLGLIKIRDAWRNRFKIDISHVFRGDPEIGNDIYRCIHREVQHYEKQHIYIRAFQGLLDIKYKRCGKKISGKVPFIRGAEKLLLKAIAYLLEAHEIREKVYECFFV